jgi:hypothetical protein
VALSTNHLDVGLVGLDLAAHVGEEEEVGTHGPLQGHYAGARAGVRSATLLHRMQSTHLTVLSAAAHLLLPAISALTALTRACIQLRKPSRALPNVNYCVRTLHFLPLGKFAAMQTILHP